jgi:hypothetical protein
MGGAFTGMSAACPANALSNRPQAAVIPAIDRKSIPTSSPQKSRHQTDSLHRHPMNRVYRTDDAVPIAGL